MQVNSQDFDSRSAHIRYANGAAKKSHTLHASMIVFGFFTRPYPDESGLIAPIGESEIRRRLQRESRSATARQPYHLFTLPAQS